MIYSEYLIVEKKKWYGRWKPFQGEYFFSMFGWDQREFRKLLNKFGDNPRMRVRRVTERRYREIRKKCAYGVLT